MTVSRGETSNICGGCSSGADADHNRVTVSSGTVLSVTGGNGRLDGSVEGGHSAYGNASCNSVSIGVKGALDNSVEGAHYTDGDTVCNSVTISGGTFTGGCDPGIYGGFSP